MRHYLIFGLILLFQIEFLKSQDIPILEPQLGFELDFSPESISKFLSPEAFNDCRELLERVEKENRKGANKYSDEDRKILFYCDETKNEIWDIIGDGCSWYCDGGPKKVSASSYLKAQGSNTYEPKNAHDLSYKTAWVEGVDGYGIGEYLLYTFSGESPRVNKIIIVNGYVKSRAAWENNSRVKKLKMYVNNQPYAILSLKDFYGSQSFNVAPIGNSNRQNIEALKKSPDWSIKFEILDVYMGKKYDDVAITEIYFSGLDVHCLAKGTRILMADKSIKYIEDLAIGDSVTYFNFSTKELNVAKIESLDKAIHCSLALYKFESGKEITATKDHPFYIDNKGWASLNPDKSLKYKGFETIQTISIGDLFLMADGKDKLIAIDYIDNKQETFTISKLSAGENFIANGYIVGVEELIE